MEQFFDAFAALASRTLDLLHHTLGLPDEAARDHTSARSTSTVRLNHYPIGDPVPASEREGLNPLGETALGYHTDPGVLTLLLQDDTGGLQAESAEHGWIDIAPRPGTNCRQSGRHHAGVDQRSLQGSNSSGRFHDPSIPVQHPVLLQPAP